MSLAQALLVCPAGSDIDSANITGRLSIVNFPVLGASLALAAASAVKLWLLSGVDLGKDEAAYWYWAQHFTAAYAAVPLAAIRLASDFAPAGEYSLRLPFVLMGAVSAVVMYLWCRRSGLGVFPACVATCAFAGSHWIWHTSSYLHPDGFLVPFWLGSLYVADVAAARRDPRLFALLGVVVGATVMSKYSGGGLAAGLSVWVVTRPQLRGRCAFVFALALAISTSPLLLAQLQTGFHLPATLGSLSQITGGLPLTLRLLAFVLSPLLYVSPLLWLLLCLAGARLAMSAVRAPGDRLLLILLPAFFTLSVFAIFALSRGQIKGNWILPAFLGVWPFAFGARLAGDAGLALARRRGFVPVLLALGAVQAGSAAYALKMPSWLEGFQKPLDRSFGATYHKLVSPRDRLREPSVSWTDRVCEYHGWENFSGELESRLELLSDSSGESGAGTPLVSTQYQLPFAHAFYSAMSRPVYTVDDPRFRDVGGLEPMTGDNTLLFGASADTPIPVSLRGDFAVMADFRIERLAEGCAPMVYRVALLKRREIPDAVSGRRR